MMRMISFSALLMRRPIIHGKTMHNPAVAASIEKPIHNVKVLRRCRGVCKSRGANARGKSCLHPWNCQALGGAYRDRTDDPLLAKQVLSQLS